MKNNNYALFYKKDENDHWHSQRPDLPVEQWEDFAKGQGYSEFNIKDFRTCDAWDLHLTTNVVCFKGKYYLPEEKIPYPNFDAKYLGNFDTKTEWENKDEFFDADYDEVYKGIEPLSTLICVDCLVSGKVLGKFAIYAQDFIINIPKFLEELKQCNHAIYHNEELSPFKWLCWLKNDKIRLIQQNYCNQRVRAEFDILLDKNMFFDSCNKLIFNLKQYADADQKRYDEYVKMKYGE